MAIKQKTNQSIWNYLLLTVFLCVLALRATNAESINVSSLSSWTNIGNDLVSLIFSSILFLCFLLWLLKNLLQKTFVYSFTVLELPLLIFISAGLVGITIASNKRAAVNDFVTMTIPILAALMLVQLLDSDSKIRLVLAVIVALGCASAYRCAGQFFAEMQMMIEQYETDPQSMLAPLGMVPGSFDAWLFEHRLYTKGVTGFLTTSNSVASFTILSAFAALALFAEHIKDFIKPKLAVSVVFMSAAALAVVLLNFVFVRSKGGTAAFIFALVLFALLLRFGPFIKKHRRAVFIFVLLAIIICTALIINYGVQHNRLPGGNSTLVRWQYWRGAAEMYADHPITGVGPGNFNSYYPRYKAPAALETVRDPHNFALSLLTQYGPLGLAAFLLLIFVPLWKTLNPGTENVTEPKKPAISRTALLTILTLISVVILFIRPMLNPLSIQGQPLFAIAYAVFAFYIGPAIAFILGFALAWSAANSYPSSLNGITAKALFCACLGLLLHNLIDFAIFEPGIYTTLWAVIACLIAINRLESKHRYSTISINVPVRLIGLAVSIVSVFLFFIFAVLPTAKTTTLLFEARDAYNGTLLDSTQMLLKQASKADRCNPQPDLIIASLYLQYLDYYGPKQKDILSLAENSLLTAAGRDHADYRPYDKLTDVYEKLAQNSTGSEKSSYLQKSFEAAGTAAEKYPGLGRIRFALAITAEQTGQKNVALENYKLAVQIEDAYREQFRTMYPGRELFSRLGREKYEFAKQRIAALQD
ncbi:MAG: O-antigen ligase family protein [Phycisphaerae bacterium]